MLAGIRCEHCHGEGCDRCEYGTATFHGCPCRFVNDIWPALELADFARNGAWPVAGGTLDQTRCFLQVCRWYWDDEDAMKPNG